MATTKTKPKPKRKPTSTPARRAGAKRANAASTAKAKARKIVKKPCPRPGLVNADTFRKACAEYFQWCEDNPWMKTVGLDKDGNVLQIPKTRPYVVEGLINHIGITNSHWYDIQNETSRNYREDLADAFSWANNVLFTQKFTGAAVDDFKEGSVARVLGLGDRRELTGVKHPSGKVDPIQLNIDKEVEHGSNDLVRKLMKD